MDRTIQPHRALVHPLWLAALVLLAVNDHWLKGSSWAAGWLTGKLSDFAGLLVAPVVVAALLRLRKPSTLVVAHAAVGGIFAAINLFPTAAALLEALTALTPFSWTIAVDPTDLIALPMVLVSYHVFVPAMRRPLRIHPLVHRGALLAGALGCAATSQPNPCRNDPAACQGQAMELASLVLSNTTATERLIRLRPLRDSVVTDCDAVSADPTNALARALFGPAQTWLLQPGRALPLQNSDCDAYLIDADGLGMTLLFWRASDFPTHLLSTADANADEPTTIELGFEGKRLTLSAHPAVFEAPPAEPAEPPAECAVADLSVGVDWSGAVYGPQQITAVTSSPDGCHALDLNGTALYLCVPEGAMPFQVGDTIEVTPLQIHSGAYSELEAGHAPRADGIDVRSATHELVAVRGNVLARRRILGSGTLAEFLAEAQRAAGCNGSHDACGSLVSPVDVSLLGDHVPSITFMRAGDSLTLSDDYGTLYLVRAEERPVRDTECLPFPTYAEENRYYESVLVFTPAAP